MANNFRPFIDRKVVYPGFGPSMADRPNWAALADSAGAAAGLDGGMLMRLIGQESIGYHPGSWNNAAPNGHYGPMQFDPDTAKQWGMPAGRDMFNPHLAVPGAAHYIASMAQKFNSLPAALAQFKGDSHPEDPSQWKDVTRRDVSELMSGLGPASQHVGPPVIDALTMGLPPGILADAMKEYRSLGAQALGQMQRDQNDAIGRRDQAFSQLQQTVEAPTPENDPKAEFWTRLAGNISQALSPNMNGQQLSEGVLANSQKQIEHKKAQQIQLQAQQYEQLANEATKMGDLVKATKYGQKSTQLMETLKLYFGALGRTGTGGDNDPIKRKKMFYDSTIERAQSMRTEARTLRSGKDANSAKAKLRAARLDHEAGLIEAAAQSQAQGTDPWKPISDNIGLETFAKELVQGRDQNQDLNSLLGELPHMKQHLAEIGYTPEQMLPYVQSAWSEAGLPMPAESAQEQGGTMDPVLQAKYDKNIQDLLRMLVMPIVGNGMNPQMPPTYPGP